MAQPPASPTMSVPLQFTNIRPPLPYLPCFLHGTRHEQDIPRDPWYTSNLRRRARKDPAPRFAKFQNVTQQCASDRTALPHSLDSSTKRTRCKHSPSPTHPSRRTQRRPRIRGGFVHLAPRRFFDSCLRGLNPRVHDMGFGLLRAADSQVQSARATPRVRICSREVQNGPLVDRPGVHCAR